MVAKHSRFTKATKVFLHKSYCAHAGKCETSNEQLHTYVHLYVHTYVAIHLPCTHTCTIARYLYIAMYIDM